MGDDSEDEDDGHSALVSKANGADAGDSGELVTELRWLI